MIRQASVQKRRGMKARFTGSSVDSSLSYDEQRIAWRRSLREDILRSLASDYLRGLIDECTHDAFLEYVARFGPVSLRHPYASGKYRGHD